MSPFAVRAPSGTVKQRRARVKPRALPSEKRARYSSDALTVALESQGRLTGDTHRALEHVATHVAACLRDHGAAPRHIPWRRACLERVVNFSAADVDLLAL